MRGEQHRIDIDGLIRPYHPHALGRPLADAADDGKMCTGTGQPSLSASSWVRASRTVTSLVWIMADFGDQPAHPEQSRTGDRVRHRQWSPGSTSPGRFSMRPRRRRVEARVAVLRYLRLPAAGHVSFEAAHVGLEINRGRRQGCGAGPGSTSGAREGARSIRLPVSSPSEVGRTRDGRRWS